LKSHPPTRNANSTNNRKRLDRHGKQRQNLRRPWNAKPFGNWKIYHD